MFNFFSFSNPTCSFSAVFGVVGLDVNYPPTGSRVGAFGPQWVALFEKAVQPLAGGSSLEAVLEEGGRP